MAPERANRTDHPDRGLLAVLVVAAAVAVVVHVAYLPGHWPDELLEALPGLLVGWISVVTVFYAIGRLRPTAAEMPSMRGADLGIALALLSLLLAGAMANYGFAPSAVPLLYVGFGMVLYVGLALIGWSLGQRTRAVNRIVAEREEH